MSKKTKKKKRVYIGPGSVIEKKPKLTGKRVKMISCVECTRTETVVKMSACEDCEHHNDGYCLFSGVSNRIKVVSLSEPMKFNRMTFKISSEHVQDDARNYYFLTEIMSPVKNIVDCKEYTELKTKLLRGDLSGEPDKKEQYNTQIKKPIVYLEEATENVTMVYNKQGYKEVQPFNTDGEWTIIYYLYEMFSYSGLADMMIDDRSFKVKLSQVCGYPEQMLIAIRDNQIIIGERSATQPKKTLLY